MIYQTNFCFYTYASNLGLPSEMLIFFHPSLKFDVVALTASSAKDSSIITPAEYQWEPQLHKLLFELTTRNEISGPGIPVFADRLFQIRTCTGLDRPRTRSG